MREPDHLFITPGEVRARMESARHQEQKERAKAEGCAKGLHVFLPHRDPVRASHCIWCDTWKHAVKR